MVPELVSIHKRTSPIPGPSREPPPPYPSSGPIKLKIKNRLENRLDDIQNASSSSRVATVHDTLLSSSSSSELMHLDSEARTAQNATTSQKSKSNNTDNGVFGFTQYAEDSPYPAASLNFSSMFLEPTPSTSTTVPPPVTEQTETPSSTAPTVDKSNSNVCTVQTVTDLQNALKSEDDIQIVVPNELLETSEFKTFISTLNSFPLNEVQTPLNANSNEACNAPPNTPNTTRPPSTTAELKEPPMSPMPGTSQDRRFEENPDNPDEILPNASLTESDDDITLQDLVALETMEDADVNEDDQFFTLSSSTNPLEPFMNSILQMPEASNTIFTCDRCGLHYGTILEYRNHRDICRTSSIKGKKSTKKNKAKMSTNKSRATLPLPEIANDGLNTGGETSSSSWTELKTEVKAEIKSETMDSTSQPVLAATGQNWKCNQCRVVFETGPQLLEHLDLIRSSEFKCVSCHLVFDDRKMQLLHKRKFHAIVSKIKQENVTTSVKDAIPNENGEFVCDKCDRAFKHKDLFLKHMLCHDEEKPFECLECGKKFAKASLLRDHRRRHFEVGAYECGYCQKRFYTPNKLREHVRVHTGEAPLACNICGKTFKRHSNLSEHKRIHMENRPVKPQKELFCHCGKVFHTQRDLDWHKEGEHDKQPKKCKFCGEVFIHGSSLTRHIRLKHESNFMPDNKKSSLYAKCPICHQMFYKTSINKHIRIKHQGQKPYQCDVCKVSFVTKCNLLNHQWQHKGVRSRPFKCQLCNKAYLRQSLLDAHMRSHRGVKPFVCNECGLQFVNKSNWQRHVAEHSGDRNYQCPHCNKRFSRGYYLTDHLKVHTGEKPYVCGICGKMAATRSNYNSHLRTHITREPVNSEV